MSKNDTIAIVKMLMNDMYPLCLYKSKKHYITGIIVEKDLVSIQLENNVVTTHVELLP